MYILDKETNQLITAEPTTFKEQKLKERQHLQEWIAKNPEVLGEELLVIQKCKVSDTLHTPPGCPPQRGHPAGILC